MSRALLTSLVSRAFGSGAQLLINFAVGNLFGAAAVGMYYSYLSWTTLLATVFAVGLPTLVLREAAASVETEKEEVHRLLVQASQVVLVTSSTFLLVLVLTVGLLAHSVNEQPVLSPVIVLAGVFALFGAQWKLFVDFRKGRGDISRALFLEFGLVPLLFLVMIGGIELVGATPDPLELVIAYAVLSAIPATPFVWRSALKGGWSTALLRRYRRSIGSFWIVSLVNILMVSAPYVLMSLLLPLSEIGKFAVAHRLVGVSATIGTVISSYFSPVFARRMSGSTMRHAFAQSRAAYILFCVPLLALYLVFDDFFLRLFGAEFHTSSTLTALAVLVLARLIISLFGASEAFLCMSGNERYELQYAALSIVLFAVTSLLLVGSYGIVGVAVAHAIASVCRAGASYVKSRQVLNAYV